MEIGGGGCRIPKFKIKIPKKMEMEKERGHYCKECGKSFKSGKALRGHMSSAHVQGDSFSSKIKKKSGEYSSSSSSTCMLCGKVFHSKKSLFGHMRCHPEREWRGMEPPPPPPRAQLGSSSNSDHTKDAFVAALELIKMLKHDHQTKPNHHEKDCARVLVTKDATTAFARFDLTLLPPEEEDSYNS